MDVEVPAPTANQNPDIFLDIYKQAMNTKAKDKEIVKGGKYGNVSKGTGNYGKVGGYARRAIRDYLLTSKETIVIKEVDGQIVEQTANIFNYQKIWSKGLLQELAM
jgi:hypothetical protein